MPCAMCDVRYAIDRGDTIFALKIRDHQDWVIRVGERRGQLKGNTLAIYAARADGRLYRIVAGPDAHPAGKPLNKSVWAWWTKFFVFLTDCEVPGTYNISVGKTLAPVVLCGVTNGFRSGWGAEIHAGYCSYTGTARRAGQPVLQEVRNFNACNFAVA